jgi:hypothetical protein
MIFSILVSHIYHIFVRLTFQSSFFLGGVFGFDCKGDVMRSGNGRASIQEMHNTQTAKKYQCLPCSLPLGLLHNGWVATTLKQKVANCGFPVP